MSSVKLSIIVPCYKAKDYLTRCLDSLIRQTLTDIEIICVNDGSPDNCIEILEDYYKKYGDKIVIIDKQNEGVWRARMDGIKLARGEYIGFVDADDYVTLDFAEKLYTLVTLENADIAVCGFDRIDSETGKRFSREMTKFKYKSFYVQDNPGLLLEVNAAVWNKIYKAELLKNMTDLENAPAILEDMMFLQLVYINSKKIAFISDPLVNYIVRSDSTINTVKKEQIISVYESIRKVKEIYVNENSMMLKYVDANAFLHLGISLMYRLSYDKSLDIDDVIKNNIDFLDTYFPLWKHNEYISLKYVLKNKGANIKLYVVKKFYDFNMFKLFLFCYKFMINELRIDIKW